MMAKKDWIAVPKQLPPDELARTSTITLTHYNEHADSFWSGTRDHDVSQNRDALLQHSARSRAVSDSRLRLWARTRPEIFHDLGYEAIGLEGAERFVELARDYSGCEVWHQDFLKLALPAEFFDGIFANASLFHVPSQELPRVAARTVDGAEAAGRALQFQSARRK